MARVLCISSQVVYGPVGNSALVPPLQAQGHEVLALPTLVLSHHPGHGPPAVLHHSTVSFAELLASVEAVGGLDTCAAVLTGYFASSQQIASTAQLVRRMKARNPTLMVLVDPVLGDHGRLYVSTAIAEALRDELLPLASITTPNVFELGFLTGRPVTTAAEAIIAAKVLPTPEVLITSIPLSDQSLGTLLYTQDHTEVIQSIKYPDVPNGTGDYLAGAYLAARLAHAAKQAFPISMKSLECVITASLGSKILRNV